MTRTEINRATVGDMAVKALKHEGELRMKVEHAKARLESLSETLAKHGLTSEAQFARSILDALA